MAYKS